MPKFRITAKLLSPLNGISEIQFIVKAGNAADALSYVIQMLGRSGLTIRDYDLSHSQPLWG